MRPVVLTFLITAVTTSCVETEPPAALTARSGLVEGAEPVITAFIEDLLAGARFRDASGAAAEVYTVAAVGGRAWSAVADRSITGTACEPDEAWPGHEVCIARTVAADGTVRRDTWFAAAGALDELVPLGWVAPGGAAVVYLDPARNTWTERGADGELSFTAEVLLERPDGEELDMSHRGVMEVGLGSADAAPELALALTWEGLEAEALLLTLEGSIEGPLLGELWSGDTLLASVSERGGDVEIAWPGLGAGAACKEVSCAR